MYYIQLMCSLIHYGVKYYVREALPNEKTICYIYNNTFSCIYVFSDLGAGAVALHDGSRGRLQKNVRNNTKPMLLA